MKKALLFVIGLMLTSTLLAGPVGKEEAKAKALTFLGGKVGTAEGRAKAPLQQELSLASTGDAYHVFNIGSDGGFVIVSASDLTPDIIGYTDEGAFDANNIPDNMKAWLQEYANQIAWVEKNGEQVVESKVRKAPAGVKSAIAPLIQTKWNQTSPYNGMVPSGCVTGCVATAMAQMLYYCANQPGFPQGTTKVIPSYTDENSHFIESCEKITSFDWANMQLTYTGSESTTQKNAVAKLMKYCGASVNMKYGTTSSATTMFVAGALNDYFGYDHHLKNVYRDQYSNAEWEDIIYQELVEARPVLYGGKSSSTGHAFVCDGYSEDGYFHINWGWGGLHDGYYLLSVLNPEKGGAGSGSAVDGYSIIQDAVIGFQMPTGDMTAEDARLSCMKFEYTGSGNILRTDPSFTFSYLNNLKSELTYNYGFKLGIGVFNESDVLIGGSSYSGTDEFVASGATNLSGSFSLNTALFAEGKTYTIKPMHQLDGTGEWLVCKGTDVHYVQVTVDETKIFLENKSPDYILEASDITLTTNGIANSPQTITAKIKNNGTSPYRSTLYLFADGTKVSGNGVNVEPGETVIASFSYQPTSIGTPTLKITTDETGTQSITIIGGSSITITAVGKNNLDSDLTFAVKSSNLVYDVDKWKFMGKKAKATITVTNPNAADAYVGKVALILWKGSNHEEYFIEEKDLYLSAGASTDVSFEYDLVQGDTYKPDIQYVKNNAWKHMIFVKANTYYSIADVITTIAANGTETTVLPTATYTVPADAAVVDLRGQSVVTSLITTAANPNCLYLADTDPISDITKNWVKGTTAANIELTDGYDFYTPIDFTATNISYTRQFTTGADGSGNGWNTIVLPFDVAEVKQGTTPLDWFKSSSDAGKNFWLYQFVIDGKGTVNFDYASAIKANTPYLITVPSNHWGDEFDLRNKDITFSATDVTVKANEKNTQSGFYYMFTGGSQKQSVAVGEGYVLNAEGNKFKKVEGSSKDVPAFQAYFYPSSHNLQSDALAISFVDNSEVTGILSVESEEQTTGAAEGWYTLQGVKLDGEPTQKGIYIYNGKKVMVK